MPYVMASVYPIVMLGALGVGRTEYETVDDPCYICYSDAHHWKLHHATDNPLALVT